MPAPGARRPGTHALAGAGRGKRCLATRRSLVDSRISDLLARITSLDDELSTAWRKQETQLFYRFNGKRVEFESANHVAQRKLKMGLLRWVVAGRPRNCTTGPLIWSLAVPLGQLDLFVTVYRVICSRSAGWKPELSTCVCMWQHVATGGNMAWSPTLR